MLQVSRFVKRETFHFDLGDGDWVDLITRLSFGEREKIQQALIAPAVREGQQMAAARGSKNGLTEAEMVELAGRPNADLDLAASNIELLVQAIAAWGGPGFCSQEMHPHAGPCTAVSITRQAIERLDDTGRVILVELEQRLTKRAPDFTKPRLRRSHTAGRRGSTQSV